MARKEKSNISRVQTGRGKLREIFPLKSRGMVLALENGFSGKISTDGEIQSERGIAPYKGPDFLDYISEHKAFLAVIVRHEFAALFEVGQEVTFHGPSKQMRSADQPKSGEGSGV